MIDIYIYIYTYTLEVFRSIAGSQNDLYHHCPCWCPVIWQCKAISRHNVSHKTLFILTFLWLSKFFWVNVIRNEKDRSIWRDNYRWIDTLGAISPPGQDQLPGSIAEPNTGKTRRRHQQFMMTSSNGNIFRVTGHLCGKFTGPRLISHTKASDAELWCFLWFTPE